MSRKRSQSFASKGRYQKGGAPIEIRRKEIAEGGEEIKGEMI